MQDGESCFENFQCKTSFTCKDGVCSSSSVCPSGWTFSFGKCYYFSGNVTIPWNDAREQCLSQGAELMKINNQDEYNFLKNIQQQLANGGSVWVINI